MRALSLRLVVPTPLAILLFSSAPSQAMTAQCSVSVSAGRTGSGSPYADVSYSVSLSSGGAHGGYGITKEGGPCGTPANGCAGRRPGQVRSRI